MHTTNDNSPTAESRKVTADTLKEDIHQIGERIEAYNAHFLNHKHLVNGFAVLIMALIFLGMLVTTIELYLWGLCGVLIAAFIAIMVYRGRLAKRLDAEMAAAQKALKEYERGRRRKK